jgi:ectoine hydroxylase-related dioxygenase (phytanoyl-CoA dioxygenase family)
MSIQISLVDTSGEQGAFQVLAATHHGAARAGEEGQEVDSLDELGLLGVEERVQGIVVAVPAGTVVMYSPNAMHRGRGNDTDKERVSLTLTLMGANGLVPEGIPLAICLEDEGKWYLDVARAQGHLMHRLTSSTLAGGQSEHPTSGSTIQMGARSPWI